MIIKPTTADYFLEGITFLGVIVLLALPVMYYNELPESIPRQYGSSGTPSAFSGKGIIWTLPIIGIFMYFGMMIVNRFPHTFNYPRKVTHKNVEPLYRISTRMMRVLNLIVTWAIVYITFMTIQTALGFQNGLSIYFAPGLVFLILAAIGYYFSQMRKLS